MNTGVEVENLSSQYPIPLLYKRACTISARQQISHKRPGWVKCWSRIKGSREISGRGRGFLANDGDGLTDLELPKLHEPFHRLIQEVNIS